MSSLRHFPGVKPTNTNSTSSSKVVRSRCHPVSTAESTVTPGGTPVVPVRNRDRGSRLSASVRVTSTDNTGTAGAGRGVNTTRRRKSLDKVCIFAHICPYSHVIAYKHISIVVAVSKKCIRLTTR